MSSYHARSLQQGVSKQILGWSLKDWLSLSSAIEQSGQKSYVLPTITNQFTFPPPHIVDGAWFYITTVSQPFDFIQT